MFRFLAVLALVLLPGAAEAGEACQQQALRQLARLAPAGYSIYQRIGAKQEFLRWVTCDDIQLGLTTAVHESVHLLTEEIDAYPLINGEKLPRAPEGGGLLAPKTLAGKFDATSSFVTNYLKPGAASSADEFRYLLDEFNAYAHDLNAAVELQPIASPNRDVYHRDGLAALMSFVAAYVEEARAGSPRTWAELQKPVLKSTVARLWDQAERVMAGSCSSPRFGLEAPQYLARVCAVTIRHGLAMMLGRPPLCPKQCALASEAAHLAD